MMNVLSPASPASGSWCLLFLALLTGSACFTAGEAEAAELDPLDKVLGIAQETLTRVEEEVQDYTAIITKRERISGKLAEAQQMSAKIRHQQKVGDRVKVPKSVYLKFLKPDSLKGREVILVE